MTLGWGGIGFSTLKNKGIKGIYFISRLVPIASLTDRYSLIIPFI